MMVLIHRFVVWISLAALFCTSPANSAEVQIKNGIAYRTDKEADDTRHKLDVYSPKEAKNAPVLFFVHGGAWIVGDKWTFAGPAKSFAEAGFVVVCTNYRLTPKVKHPGHIEDVAKAFAWTVDNIAKYGGDPKKIVISGHSAGGHLVALLGTNETYLKAEKKSFADIRGIIGLSGVYNIDHRVKMFHITFGDSEDVCKKASPVQCVSEKHPPMLLLYAEKDAPTLVQGAIEFNKKLSQAKCVTTVKECKGKDHLTIMMKAGTKDDPVFEDMKKFLLEYTKEQK